MENSRLLFQEAPQDIFLSTSSLTFELMPAPLDEKTTEFLIRDAQDSPILHAAIESQTDMHLVGDKNFLESGIDIQHL